jgi:hypothetical protein
LAHISGLSLYLCAKSVDGLSGFRSACEGPASASEELKDESAAEIPFVQTCQLVLSLLIPFASPLEVVLIV